jgi:hypothetical protein
MSDHRAPSNRNAWAASSESAVERFLWRCHDGPLMISPSEIMLAHRLQMVKAVSRMLGDGCDGLFTSG